jgi:hypothetical protein
MRKKAKPKLLASGRKLPTYLGMWIQLERLLFCIPFPALFVPW